MAEPLRIAPRAGLAERRENSLLSLFELSHELDQSRDPFAIAQITALNAMGHFGARRLVLWGFPEETPDRAVTLCAFGCPDADLAAIGRALRGAAELAAGGASEATVLRLPGAAAAAGLALAIPVGAHGRRLGAMAFGERVSGEPYGDLDVDHANAAARMFGGALENARLYQRMSETNRRLRRANEDLTETDRLKVEFVSNVNHEMRTPITVVLGFLELLKDSGGLNDFQRTAIEKMTAHTQKLSRIVQDLLEFSSLSSGRAPLPTAPLDAASLVERYAVERRPGVLEGLRQLELDLATGAPVLGDPRGVEKVLDAFVDNAVKFSPPGGRIVLRVRALEGPEPAWVAVEVEDDGPGIAAEQLPFLFEAFRQGDGSSTRTVGGMGLGLALAKQLAERMGGRVEADSPPGRGATFRLLLRRA